ncbi:hypothetical protein T265_12710, partial [Opisthorchis viverrini]
VRGSNPTSASRLHLSRLGQPGSIPGLALPSAGMAARHREGFKSLFKNLVTSSLHYAHVRRPAVPNTRTSHYLGGCVMCRIQIKDML